MSAGRSLPRAGYAVGSLAALTVLGTGLNLTGVTALPWWLVLAALLLVAGLVAWRAPGDYG